MNFFADKPGASINNVGVHMHSTHIILIINDKNTTYLHADWEKAIDFLKDSFGESKIEFIEKYIIDNLEHIGARYKAREVKPKDNDQLSLF